MANAKRSRRSPPRREPPRREAPTSAAQLLRQLLPMLRCSNLPGRRSAPHLRRAAIEVLEAMRALLDETIEWLQQDEKGSPELKRIRVEGE